jgi:hypothetical protein
MNNHSNTEVKGGRGQGESQKVAGAEFRMATKAASTAIIGINDDARVAVDGAVLHGVSGQYGRLG